MLGCLEGGGVSDEVTGRGFINERRVHLFASAHARNGKIGRREEVKNGKILRAGSVSAA